MWSFDNVDPRMWFPVLTGLKGEDIITVHFGITHTALIMTNKQADPCMHVHVHYSSG